MNKFVQTNKDGKRDMAFHFQPLPQDTKSSDFIEGNGDSPLQPARRAAISHRASP